MYYKIFFFDKYHNRWFVINDQTQWSSSMKRNIWSFIYSWKLQREKIEIEIIKKGIFSNSIITWNIYIIIISN